jgi:single-stranded-DNA-specific exonuclease
MSADTRWLLPEIERSQAQSLAAALGVHEPVARVLVRRGYRDPEAARRFLEAPLDDLHDPFLLQDMPAAASRLLEAVREGQQILLYGDYDVDGITSVVILKKAIELAGGRASFHIPHRLRDGYGMRADVVERAASAGVKLLISVDTGIRAAEAVARARELGIDVIVTDHHLPDAELPPACAVLNPKRPGCRYPEKNLCGAGVAFKLVQALLQSVGWPPERQRRVLESLLKLVAIGTVADVVPLTGENRVLVKHGLEGLRSVRNPGLRALLDVAGFAEGDTPSAPQVAFRIAPRMNAAGRMADASDVIDLFLTEDPERARELAARLHELNQERQQAETEIVRSILEECSRVPVTREQKALVFAGPGWHRGVAGIVASRLVERFHRPAVVLGVDPETGLAQGSGRSIPAFHLLEALESMPDLFVQFGGHHQAAGLTLAAGRVAEFRGRFNDYARARLSDEDLAPVLEIDAVLGLREIDDSSVAEILLLAPFGFGNPPPVFAVLGAEVAAEPAVWKDKHLRVRLRQQGRTLTVKAWNFAERAGELRAGTRVDVALCFEADTYSLSRGFPGWSATLRDVRAVP